MSILPVAILGLVAVAFAQSVVAGIACAVAVALSYCAGLPERQRGPVLLDYRGFPPVPPPPSPPPPPGLSKNPGREVPS